jgi:hypothetical protein
MTRKIRVFRSDLKKNSSLKSLVKFPNPIYSIGEIIFHLWKIRIREKVTGKATKIIKCTTYGEIIM